MFVVCYLVFWFLCFLDWCSCCLFAFVVLGCLLKFGWLLMLVCDVWFIVWRFGFGVLVVGFKLDLLYWFGFVWFSCG